MHSLVPVDGDYSAPLRAKGSLGLQSPRLSSHITDSLPAQTISTYRILSMPVCNNAEGINVEMKVCCLIGFNPTTYTLEKKLVSTYQELDFKKERIL